MKAKCKIIAARALGMVGVFVVWRPCLIVALCMAFLQASCAVTTAFVIMLEEGRQMYAQRMS